MNEFLRLIIDILQQSIGLAICAVVLFGIGLAVAYIVYRKINKDKKFPWKKALAYLLFVGYIVILLAVTILRYRGGFRDYSLYLFRAWREAWNSFSMQLWLNVLLNIALFIPLGALLPIMFKPFKKWYIMLPSGFGCSLIIELIQLALGRGIFDVDDLLTNTLGCMFGYCIVLAVSKFELKNRKSYTRSLIYLIYPLVLVMGISGIFIAYQVQEYGNLAEAPAFTVNLKDVEWKLECALDDTLQSAPIYKGTKATKDEIKKFADAFAQKAGVTFPDVYYYDTTTVFANHSTGDFLTIEHQGFIYEYTIGMTDPMLENAELSESVVRELASSYGIDIPEEAVFSYDGNGKHTFSADMIPMGDKVLDGEIYCYGKEGEVLREIRSEQFILDRYNDTQIISQTEAYERLCDGKFNGAEYYKYINAKSITVLSCELDYCVDSKGFYQPVYRFELKADDGYGSYAVIPALK